jgi:hypothetical protein
VAPKIQDELDEWLDEPVAGQLSKITRRMKDTRIFESSFDRMMRISASKRAADGKVQAAMQDLLTRLAFTLQYLCIERKLFTTSTVFHRPIPLPALLELTCRLPGPYGSSLESTLHLRSLFPSLERLHFTGPSHTYEHPSMISNPQELPPSLKFVRFSDVCFLLDILSALTHDPWAAQESFDMIITSRESVVKPGSSVDVGLPPLVALPTITPPMHSWDSTTYSEFEAELSKWHNVASANKNILGKVHVVNDPAFGDYRVHRLYEEWLARLQGNRGCWKEGTPLALADL